MTMKIRVGFFLAVVGLGGMLLSANEDSRSFQEIQIAQLQRAELAHSNADAANFSNVTVTNDFGIAAVTVGWQPETTAFTNRGDGGVLVNDFNGFGKVIATAAPNTTGFGTVGMVGVFDSAGEVAAFMSAESGFHSKFGDIAENFPGSELRIDPGSVMVLDSENPGSLKRSSGAYDRRVAGVASGAEDYRPGMTLRGGIAQGVPVTLTGTVYCKVTNANGAIEAGDLLTTSNVSGHAMKATDATKSHGAVLGKAMEDFDEESGLMMILAALQ